jgi:hypothetical protein
MTLLDAQQYDQAGARRRRLRNIVLIVLIIFLAWFAYHLRNYSERHAVDKFFSTLQKHDYESAYGIWWNDPDWKQHQQKYSNYPFNDFYRQTTVNHRAEHAYLYVTKADKTLSFSPNEIQCGSLSWLIE